MRFSTMTLLLACALPAQDPPSLQGRVVDVLGDPVPVATIELVVAGRVVARTTCDGDGVFHLRASAERAELRVGAAGKAQLRLPWLGHTSARVRNFTLEDASRLQGRVADAAGAAVAGATVVVVAGDYSAEVTSDAQGTYELAAVPLRRAVVRATKRSSLAERSVRLLADTRCDLTLPARGEGTRVVHVKGLPAEVIPMAHVAIISTEMTRLGNGGRVPLRADGTAEFHPTCTSFVQFSAPGFTAIPDGYLLTGGDAPIEFRVQPSEPTRTTLSGQVIDNHNRPIGAHLLLAHDRSHRTVGITTIGADGRFEMAVDLAPHAFCRLGLELRDWQIVDETASIADGFSWMQTTAEPDLTLTLVVDPVHGVSSDLKTDSGERLLFAEVVVADPDAPHRALIETATDRTGRVVLHLPAGDFAALATTTEGLVAQATARIRDRGESRCEWTIVPTGTIEGRVLTAGGQPLPGVKVFVASTALQDENNARASERQACVVTTDRHGRYRCRGLGAGTWTVVALGEPGIAGASGDVARQKTTSIDLEAR
ncbi:MAG TPA: carboxypeptidase-like regulatory domain-containing protein [Planctomycetota bacterium]|nr:carboxypeptidase-like regulatory domain-containing protein [Planctomycetota bacterium]